MKLRQIKKEKKEELQIYNQTIKKQKKKKKKK